MLVIAASTAVQCVRVAMFNAAPGRVVAARLESLERGRTNLHTPVVQYTYVVGGRQYRNEVYSVIDNQGTIAWARGVLREFPVGGACTVYFNRANPQQSALTNRPTTGQFCFMLGLAAFGVVVLVGGCQNYRALS